MSVVAVEPAAVWLLDPREGDSWALTGEYDDLRWMTLAGYLAGSGFEVVPVEHGPVKSLPEPCAVIVNGLNRTASQAIRMIRQTRQRFPSVPIYITGRAGHEIAAAAVDKVQHASEDQLAAGLGADGRLRPAGASMLWWRSTTPSRPNGPRLPLGVLEVEATRGCTHHCTFCSVFVSTGASKRTWQPRPPADVAAEIAHWHTEAGIDRVQFIDDNFLGSPARAPGWADQLAIELRCVPELRFSIFARLDGALLRALPSLRAAGLVQVHAGVESASDSVLRRLSKGETIEEMENVGDALAAAGVELVPSFIVFEARATPAEVLATLDWIERRDLIAWFTPTTALPFAGTVLTKQLAVATDPRFLNADGSIAEPRVPFSSPIVAEAYRVAVEFDRDVGHYLTPGLDELMRRRMVRDGDLYCGPIKSDGLLVELADYRRAQLSAVRSVLEAG